jgi:RNA polymerase sigma factor (sigma-70 family)
MSDPSESFGTHYLNERVARWQGGDRAAADELLRAVAVRLERLARKMLRDFPRVRALADTCDVVSAASMRLLNALRSVRPASTREFFTLSAVQIRRELLDLADTHTRRRTVEMKQSQAEAIAAPSVAEEVDLWCAFHQAVEALPLEEREVVSLIFYHDWKQHQVGELLGVDERTVRRYWRSAVGRLSSKLDGRFPSVE